MIENLEEYVKKVLKIPYCNFEGVDPRIAYEIVVGLSLMYEMYPFFNRVICAIESPKDYESHSNILKFSDKTNNLCELNSIVYEEYNNDSEAAYSFNGKIHYCNVYKYKLPLLINKNFSDFFALIIHDYIKNYSIPDFELLKTTRVGRISMYHEFGHMMDLFLHISTSDKLKEIIKGHDIEKEITKNACKNNRELVADAFMLYILSNWPVTKLEQRLGINKIGYRHKASPLVLEIGKLIDEEYKKFTKFRQIKFINERYNFNKRFTIVKNDITKKEIVKLEESFKKL